MDFVVCSVFLASRFLYCPEAVSDRDALVMSFVACVAWFIGVISLISLGDKVYIDHRSSVLVFSSPLRATNLSAPYVLSTTPYPNRLS